MMTVNKTSETKVIPLTQVGKNFGHYNQPCGNQQFTSLTIEVQSFNDKDSDLSDI